ncbi:MAG: HlyD family efflux transporter periplasmic adaptor subunit [Planctomycetia bacterium]|nr:HlyD family efflux transporter periplasmic adaptor subunit [Planctomycetia bacterium]
MSIEQPIDPQTIEATRAQIRGAVAEIAGLAGADIEPREFFEKFLAHVVASLSAAGGAVWVVASDGKRFELNSPHSLPQTGLPQDLESQQSHAQLVGQVLTSGEPAAARPGPWAGDDGEGGNPTPYLLLLAPLTTGAKPYGIVEVFQRPGASGQVQRGYLNFLVQTSTLAADYLKSRELKTVREREALWDRLDQLGEAVHRSLDLKETAYTLANEAVALVECDRASVVVCRGRRARVEAVSGQDTVEKRANAVRLLLALAERVIKSGQPLWYTGTLVDVPPQIEEVLHAYIDETHTRTLGVIPLVREIESDPENDDETPPKFEILGVLVIERIDEAGLTDTLCHRTDLVSRRGSAALANALDHDRVFLMPVWKTLGKSRWFVEARRLPKTVAAVGVAVVVIIALCIVPADFRITAQGTLQPSERRDVFVQEAGVVNQVDVEHGAKVTAGSELAQLRSRDLEVQITEVRGRRAATLEQLGSARRSQAEPRLTFDERTRLSGQYAQLQKTYDSLDEQLKLLKAKQELLTIRSPIDGLVTTWDVQKRLADRPVEKGQVLLSVADPKSPWELELLLPEAHAGFVTSAWEGKPADQRTLPVSYILATDPAKRRDGQVIEIQQSAEVRGEDGNTVMVRVKIDPTTLDTTLRPGAAVTGRIYCGRRPIGYVWFHDVLAFIRAKILFRL